MTTKMIVYGQEPDFPPEDQFPEAKRFQVGNLWVDTDGAEPSEEDIQNFFNPPAKILAAYQDRAKAALAVTDLTAQRCFKAGIAFPSAWQTYTAALRVVAGASSGDPTQPLPTQPAFPPNT